ncbi:GntR family transcriptional regulator [Criibacterium bergeronii]|uniref:GntR family transcriptional regulator n=1 Tax=Criibacterium bergeronii TaxID=1871336 RepID=A0A371IJ46_9FIRM|nr:GntR family transcriptional regulator [Criibacterium bergeronii]MBS6062253.1 GntR family transcriptional regulator [Peptostreptococcaceae bacterium]RDY20501.1 GntR family transcriptional regulator [Criibacterium bergeronii]
MTVLNKKIIYGELEPYEDVPEEKLQKELKISRTPIREALTLIKNIFNTNLLRNYDTPPVKLIWKISI